MEDRSRTPAETAPCCGERPACCPGAGAAGATEQQPGVTAATGVICTGDRFDHFLARWGWRRSKHLVRPGLYALGEPSGSSPVFVTANYTLSFDALRGALSGIDAYILVLDTLGVNVWCAAGKGTFGTEELARRIESTRLGAVVEHRELLLPQLGATGVAAYEVRGRTGFKVRFGPVRARDIPEYLERGEATPEMRLVRFRVSDRLAIAPIELVHAFLPAAVLAVAVYFLFGLLACLAVIASVLAGTVLFAFLLPWIPGRDFSVKGFLLGALVVLPFAVAIGLAGSGAWWERLLRALPLALILPSLTAFLALNFTGTTTFTSKTWVRREIFTYVPVMAALAGGGIIVAVAYGIARAVGG